MVDKRVFNRRKKFYIISGILLVLFLGGCLFWKNYKYRLVNKKLDQLVSGKSKGLYQLGYQKLVIDEALGSVTAENVSLLPDSIIFRSLVDGNKAPADLFFIQIPKLSISGVKTPKALLNKEISAHIIRIEDAQIEIRLGRPDKNKKPDFGALLNGDIYRQLLGKLQSIQADSVVIENAHITLKDMQSKSIRYTAEAEGFSLRFAGIAIDSSIVADSTKILFSNEIAFHCNQLLIPTKNRMYEMQISGLDFNSVTGNLHSGQIHLKPSLSETAFAKANHFAKDRFNISVGSLDISHISRQAILKQQLVAESMTITQGRFLIFRDKSYPHDSVDRTNDYPQQAIMRMSLPVDIRKIMIRDSYIEYKEKNDKSDSSGKVAFHQVFATLDNVTNFPDQIRRNDQMGLDFKANFLSTASFTARIKMRLNDPKGHFTLDATLGHLDVGALNPLLKPMALAELNKGEINSLKYHLDASNTEGKGKLLFLYQDLSVKLLKKDDEKNKYKTKFLPTLAAGVILKKSNPQNGKTRLGEIDYQRDIHRSIFNLMWKSLFTGIKQVAM